ncbi:hypothetical protein scyTo_0024457, partial [Scyliorhinus torazame]|nr:hypothetical protein [Scyliorhinus torazame]
GEKESLANVSFRQWLQKKHLSNVLRVSASFVKPRQTVSELMVQQLRDSVKIEGEDESKQTCTLVPFPKPRGPCRPRRDPGSERSGLDSGGRDRAAAGSKTGTCAKSHKGVCQAKPTWNVSTNPTSLPMADIYGQIQADSDSNLNSMLQRHDFGILFQLALDRVGQPVVRSKVREKTWPLPTLPLDLIKKELFPDSVYQRIRMPGEFKAVNVVDLPKKRRLVRDKSEIAMHLREWLEPNMSCLTSSSPHSTRKVESISPAACAKRTPQPLDKQYFFQSGTKCQSLNLATMTGTALAEFKECSFECRDRS